jgi:hypothetical protein
MTIESTSRGFIFIPKPVEIQHTISMEEIENLINKKIIESSEQYNAQILSLNDETKNLESRILTTREEIDQNIKKQVRNLFSTIKNISITPGEITELKTLVEKLNKSVNIKIKNLSYKINIFSEFETLESNISNYIIAINNKEDMKILEKKRGDILDMIEAVYLLISDHDIYFITEYFSSIVLQLQIFIEDSIENEKVEDVVEAENQGNIHKLFNKKPIKNGVQKNGVQYTTSINEKLEQLQQLIEERFKETFNNDDEYLNDKKIEIGNELDDNIQADDYDDYIEDFNKNHNNENEGFDVDENKVNEDFNENHDNEDFNEDEGKDEDKDDQEDDPEDGQEEDANNEAYNKDTDYLEIISNISNSQETNDVDENKVNGVAETHNKYYNTGYHQPFNNIFNISYAHQQ